MEEYLNAPIKEVITKFPKVGEILEEYDIGCVPCAVGSCLLKDIMEIHNLSDVDEQQLLISIARVIYPDREVTIPKIGREKKAKPGEFKYSPPLKRLVDEHSVIKRFLALIPKIIESMDAESEEGRQIVQNSTNFIRFYADKYHHAKEEEILFKYFDENLDILEVICQDHENARAHVRAMFEGLSEKNTQLIKEHFHAYHELLNEHIKKEDEILYPWMDRNLSTAQIGELFSQFREVEEASDKVMIEDCIKFLENIEEKLQNNKEQHI